MMPAELERARRVEEVLPALHEAAPRVDAKGEFCRAHIARLRKAKLLDSSAAQHRQRDVRNRSALFSPEVDPVWKQVAGLIGEQNGEHIRRTLREVAD